MVGGQPPTGIYALPIYNRLKKKNLPFPNVHNPLNLRTQPISHNLRGQPGPKSHLKHNLVAIHSVRPRRQRAHPPGQNQQRAPRVRLRRVQKRVGRRLLHQDHAHGQTLQQAHQSQ